MKPRTQQTADRSSDLIQRKNDDDSNGNAATFDEANVKHKLTSGVCFKPRNKTKLTETHFANVFFSLDE